MVELIHEYAAKVTRMNDRPYVVRAFGEERPDGTWEGWIEFHPVDGKGPVLRTNRETSQPNRKALFYWATGLEEIYFDGAMGRAA